MWAASGGKLTAPAVKKLGKNIFWKTPTWKSTTLGLKLRKTATVGGFEEETGDARNKV